MACQSLLKCHTRKAQLSQESQINGSVLWVPTRPSRAYHRVVNVLPEVRQSMRKRLGLLRSTIDYGGRMSWNRKIVVWLRSELFFVYFSTSSDVAPRVCMINKPVDQVKGSISKKILEKAYTSLKLQQSRTIPWSHCCHKSKHYLAAIAILAVHLCRNWQKVVVQYHTLVFQRFLPAQKSYFWLFTSRKRPQMMTLPPFCYRLEINCESFLKSTQWW